MNFFLYNGDSSGGVYIQLGCRITTTPTITCPAKWTKSKNSLPPQNQQRPTTVLLQPPTNFIRILIRQRDHKTLLILGTTAPRSGPSRDGRSGACGGARHSAIRFHPLLPQRQLELQQGVVPRSIVPASAAWNQPQYSGQKTNEVKITLHSTRNNGQLNRIPSVSDRMTRLSWPPHLESLMDLYASRFSLTSSPLLSLATTPPRVDGHHK